MGLDDTADESVCSSSTSPAAPAAEELVGHQGELPDEEEEEEVHVSRVLWCYGLQVEEQVEQKEVCLVLTDRLLGLLFLSNDFTWTKEVAGKNSVSFNSNMLFE